MSRKWGGEVVKNNFLRKIFFGTKGTNNLQVFNHLNLAALHYGHPLTTWFVGKFYTHTPPCLNRLATALVELCTNNIDICFVTETWLNDKIPSSLVCLGNYVFVRKDRCDSRSGGGVAILCRDDWKVKNLDFDNNLECMCLV